MSIAPFSELIGLPKPSYRREAVNGITPFSVTVETASFPSPPPQNAHNPESPGWFCMLTLGGRFITL